MKREAITANESQLNDDMLLPLIDDMLNCRKAFCDRINHMYGTDITVDWSSAWKNNDVELNLVQELMESEIEGGDNDEESENDEGNVPEPDIR